LTRRRWIADEVSGDRAALIGEHAAHLARVLRARVGQRFDIATGPSVRSGQITSIADDRVEFVLGEQIFTPVSPRITLLLAIFKFDRMEWVIEKCTELGVSQIVPLIAQRTDRHLASAAGKRVQRWRRIALQASEQSRRPTPPEIAAPAKLRDLASLKSALRIVLAESEHQALLRDLLQAPPGDEVALAVGPEGGWTAGELQHLQNQGWVSASLGSTILRAETAAIAATAIVLSSLA